VETRIWRTTRPSQSQGKLQANRFPYECLFVIQQSLEIGGVRVTLDHFINHGQ